MRRIGRRFCPQDQIKSTVTGPVCGIERTGVIEYVQFLVTLPKFSMGLELRLLRRADIFVVPWRPQRAIDEVEISVAVQIERPNALRAGPIIGSRIFVAQGTWVVEQVAAVFKNDDLARPSGASQIDVTVLIEIAGGHDARLVDECLGLGLGEAPVAVATEKRDSAVEVAGRKIDVAIAIEVGGRERK